MGIRVDANNATIDSAGAAGPGPVGVGPLARGSRFEATAVPELRVMAETAAANALDMLAQDVPGGTAERRYFYMAMPVGDLSHMFAALPASVSHP